MTFTDIVLIFIVVVVGCFIAGAISAWWEELQRDREKRDREKRPPPGD
ncbi:hypothetical protein ES703_55774 [subsurface metagenome]